jgi:integrase
VAFFFGPTETSRRELTCSGFGRFAHIPFILGHDLEYLDHVNRFLRDRAWGLWTPETGVASPFAKRKILSENTISAYSRDLENFWSYLETKNLKWEILTYLDILDGYDRDMASGAWSATGDRLSNATINRRVDRAVEFLKWAADRNLRPSPVVPTSTLTRATGRRSHRQSHTAVETRIGKRRVDPKHLRLPTLAEINLWLGEVKVRRGKTKALACQFIIETGTRLEEVVLLRADQLPDPDTISIDRPARMVICFGTKGQRSIGDTKRKGKERTLRFERDFLIKLHNYKQLGRAVALARFRKLNPGKTVPLELFLDESTGQPLTRSSLYRAWHNAKTLPFAGFSPHTGRHTFACFTLLRILQEEYQLIASSLDHLPRSAVLQNAENLVEIYIKPVLGHASRDTTERYLDWIADQLWVGRHRADWSLYLEGNLG